MSDSPSLDAFADSKLAEMDRAHLRRRLVITDPLGATEVEREGKRLLNFSSNDYLGLNRHPVLERAAMDAIEQFGVGSGASRLVTGNHPLYGELERKLADLKGTDDACVFGSGYLANTGIIPALIGADDMVVVDELSHACIYAGSRLSAGEVHVFRHNDVDHLREILGHHRANHTHAMIVTDRVFSMDGDLAPVDDLSRIADEFDAWLMTDDAHGIGVVTNNRGATPLQMGTLSKAVGAYGGYLCASQPVIDLIRTRCRTLIYSTGLPPGVVAAAIAAVDLFRSDPEFAAQPLRKARAFTKALGLKQAMSPIVPIILGSTERTMEASRLLQDEGFLVIAIRPPTVPDGTARLRVTFSAAHEDADISRLVDIIKTKILPPS